MSDKVTVIPVIPKGDHYVVFEGGIKAEGKLHELRTYLSHNPHWFENSLSETVGAMLRHVGKVIDNGTNIYECSIGIDEAEHGKLVFVECMFRSAGMLIFWSTIADDIQYYLDPANQEPKEVNNA